MKEDERECLETFIDEIYDKFCCQVGNFLNNEGSALFLLQVINCCFLIK